MEYPGTYVERFLILGALGGSKVKIINFNLLLDLSSTCSRALSRMVRFVSGTGICVHVIYPSKISNPADTSNCRVNVVL